METAIREALARSELEGEHLANRVRFAVAALSAALLITSYGAQTPAANIGFAAVVVLMAVHSLVWRALLRSRFHRPWQRYVSVVIEVCIVFSASLASLRNHSGVYEVYRSPGFWLLVALVNALSALRLRAGLCLCAFGASLAFGGVELAVLVGRGDVPLVGYSNFVGPGLNLPDLIQPVVMVPMIALFAAMVVRRNRALVVRAARETARRSELAADHARAVAEAASLLEAADEKRRFLRVVSHELRTPLQILGLAAERMATAEGDETVKQNAARIGRQVERLSRIVEQLVLQERPGEEPMSVVPEDCDLVALCGQVIQEAQPGSERIDMSGPAVLCGRWDSARLEQVVANLVLNALRYSPPDTRVHLTLRTEGDAAVLEVHDHGIGIPDGEIAQIFTPFFRASNARRHNAAGVGVGLYVSDSIVRRHGGTIEVRSEPETTFIVKLPLRPWHGQGPSPDAQPSGGR